MQTLRLLNNLDIKSHSLVTNPPSLLPVPRQKHFNAEAKAGQVFKKRGGHGYKEILPVSCTMLGLCLHPLSPFEGSLADLSPLLCFLTEIGRQPSRKQLDNGEWPVNSAEGAGEGLRWSLSVVSANKVRAPKPSNRAGDIIGAGKGFNVLSLTSREVILFYCSQSVSVDNIGTVLKRQGGGVF